MTYLLTAVPLTRDCRQGETFRVLVTSAFGQSSVETKFERDFGIDHPALRCKVIDIRPLHQDRHGDCLCGKPVWQHFDPSNRKLNCEEARA